MKKILVLCFVLGLISCNNDIDNSIPVTQKSVNKSSYVPQLFAKELAYSLQNEVLRSFVKEEALKQKDGDYDILFAEVIDKEVAGASSLKSSQSMQLTFRDYLLKGETMTRSLGESTNDEILPLRSLLEDINESYPLLQISIPNMETASWEGILSGKTPFMVAFLPEDYDDASGSDIVAFDQEGNQHILSGIDVPEMPVVVVSESERIFSVPVSERKKYAENRVYYETSDLVYLQRNLISVDIDTPIDEDLNMPSTKALSYRASNPTYRDYIGKAKFRDQDALKSYEGWPNGRPEVAVRVIYLDNKIPVKEVEYDDKGWWKGSLNVVNTEIIKWDPKVLGQYITYHWREVDGGDDDKKVSISFPSQNIGGVQTPASSVEMTIDGSDDVIGQSSVHYDDANNREYDPSGKGSFSFWMTVKY